MAVSTPPHPNIERAARNPNGVGFLSFLQIPALALLGNEPKCRRPNHSDSNQRLAAGFVADDDDDDDDCGVNIWIKHCCDYTAADAHVSWRMIHLCVPPIGRISMAVLARGFISLWDYMHLW